MDFNRIPGRLHIAPLGTQPKLSPAWLFSADTDPRGSLVGQDGPERTDQRWWTFTLKPGARLHLLSPLSSGYLMVGWEPTDGSMFTVAHWCAVEAERPDRLTVALRRRPGQPFITTTERG